MKGALLLSEEPAIFTLVIEALESHGGRVYEDAGVQLRDEEDRLIHIYPDPTPVESPSDLAEGITVRPGVRAPDFENVAVCLVDCRWEDLFSRVMKLVADAVPVPVWVLDESNVIWSAGAVDPNAVHL